MVKLLLLVAYTANLFLLVLSSEARASARYISPPAPCPRQEPPACNVNEIWSACPIAVCAPKTCDEVGFPVPCPDFLPNGKCPVQPGCICREGYVRNRVNICVPMSHCPSCGGDSNAVSGCGTNCNRLCSNYNIKPPGACIQACQYNGCDCRPGFVYDEITEKCVFPSKCTLLTCNVKNEIYDPCPPPNPSHTCGVDDTEIACIPPLQPGDPDCPPPRCRCRDGYYKNDVGQCVRAEDCPFCSGLNEIYDPCPARCPPQECGVNIALILCARPPELGDPECQPGCRCIDNYVKNYTGVCIPRDQCPTCPNSNEVYDPCIDPCPRHRCDVDDRLIDCVPPPQLGDKNCVAGCRCADGYYLNGLGKCVTRDECPTCPNPNEVYDLCIAPCPPRRCDVDDRLIRCAAPPKLGDKKCVAGCRCADGYYRNNYGICVTRDQCPPKCKGKHEVYNECIEGDCLPKTCDEIGTSIACPRIDPRNCTKGCLCEEGYVRGKNNVCIPKSQCPSCGGDPNAVSGCGVNCNKRCSDIGKEPGACIEICYENACDCKDGYYYQEDTKKCVPREQCTPKCKGKHEVYNECIEGDCLPKTCDEIGTSIACPRIDPRNCTKGCLCAEGYVRGKNNVCIPKSQCPSCGGDPNAVSGCGVNCNKRCSDIGKEPGACIAICYENACDCKDGYYYHEDTKKCVPLEQCTPKCKANEIFSDCIENNCNPRNCSQVGFGFPLNCEIENQDCCTQGCVCKVGYVRNDKGVCIPARNCPSCGGDPNAQSGCGKNCGRLCSNYMQTGIVCTLECKLNSCDCREDFVFDNNTQKCVLPKDCTPICKKNEVYSECINGGCSRKNCSQTGPVPCIKLDPKDCIKGCLCKDGYLREYNGECVPKNECRPKCNLPNEYYEPCDYNCPPNTCESLDRAYVCPIREGDVCKGQCKCKPGYYRDRKGQCLTEEQCRKCKGPNEFYSCGGACDNECSTLKTQSQTKCPIVNIKCNEKCYCDKDYARAKNETCIPIKDCDQPQCKKNEIYVDCPAWTCKPKTCKDVGYPIPCPLLAAGSKCPEKPGCVCVDGYVKNDKGVCIPVKECPSCGGDPNAVFGCGTNCGKKCEDLGSEHNVCPLICRINSCDCKDGYYFEKTKKKCVLASQCTGICTGTNEVFEDCANPTCEPKKCSELGFPLNCTYVPECNKGCVCKPGYVRNAKDVCIPKKQCRSCGGDKHAESGCGQNCGKKCYDFQNPDKPKPCTKICRVNACDCKDGYYWDENTKKCVRPQKCTPTCGIDEVFDPCINGGCAMKNCSQLGGPMPTRNPKKCIPGCSCKEGYMRSSKGVCILAEKCPKSKCSKNEKFSLCPASLCKPTRCDQLGSPIACPLIEEGCCPTSPGCICKDDYVRNDEGKCIPKTSCPIPCPENEVQDTCVNGGCGYRNCSQLDGPMLCIDPLKCEVGCTCKKNYYRDDETGLCVPQDECPKKCKKPNEVFVKCPSNCPPQTCESINKIYHCPMIKTNKSDCVGECRCKPGYYKNLAGECISKDDCLKCKGDHNYFSCGPVCDNVCCDIDKQSKKNCPIKNKQCVRQCYCQDGYARDDNGTCIPECDCEPNNYGCPDPINSTEALANFQTGNTELTIQLMKEYLESRPKENVMFSTLSILIASAQLAFKAIDDSLTQFLDLFNLTCKKEISVVLPILLESLKDPKNVTFVAENKIYANQKENPLREQYITDIQNIFNSEAENIDFQKNVEAADTINEWVSDRTRGLITDLVKPEMFSALTRLAIFNVLYFKGNWVHPFDEKKTKPAKFCLNDEESVMLPTMNQINTFQYGENSNLDAKIIVLPYVGGQFKLVIMLPNTITGLKAMIEKLDENVINQSLKSLTFERVNVSIPLMDYKSDFSDLKIVLQKLGLTAPFESNSDDFKCIFKNNEPLTISDFIQKTAIIVNEKGTVATAVTGIIVGTTSIMIPPKTRQFHWNRPGAFLLLGGRNILFSGFYTGAK